MTFLQYIIGNAITAIVVTAALIIFNPANREKRREAKLRREEDLILRLAKKIESERKPATPTIKPPKALNNQGADEIEKMSDAAICDIREGRFSVLWDDRQKWTVITESGYAVRNYDWLWDAPEEIEANGNKYKLAKKINLGHSWECEYHIVAKKTPPAPPTSGSIAIKPQVYPRSTSDELKAAIEAVDREQKENLAALRKPERECRKCKYFDDCGGKFGLCIKNEEIVDGDGVRECWTGKSTPVKAKVRPKEVRIACENCYFWTKADGKNGLGKCIRSVKAKQTHPNFWCEYFTSDGHTMPLKELEKPLPFDTVTTR